MAHYFGGVLLLTNWRLEIGPNWKVQRAFGDKNGYFNFSTCNKSEIDFLWRL